jgi:hypothetical protein
MSSSPHLLVVDCWAKEMTNQVGLLGMWTPKEIPFHVLIKDLQRGTKCTSSTLAAELESLRFLSASNSQFKER